MKALRGGFALSLSSVLITVALILAAALAVVWVQLGCTKRQCDRWARIVTRLWDDD